jgi:hypothetical protein
MQTVEIICTNNNQKAVADVLRKNDKILEVAFKGTVVPIKLFKKTPTDEMYVGRYAGLEFISSGFLNL